MNEKIIDLKELGNKINKEFDDTGKVDINLLANDLVLGGIFSSTTDVSIYIMENLLKERKFPIEYHSESPDDEQLTDEYINKLSNLN